MLQTTSTSNNKSSFALPEVDHIDNVLYHSSHEVSSSSSELPAGHTIDHPLYSSYHDLVLENSQERAYHQSYLTNQAALVQAANNNEESSIPGPSAPMVVDPNPHNGYVKIQKIQLSPPAETAEPESTHRGIVVVYTTPIVLVALGIAWFIRKLRWRQYHSKRGISLLYDACSTCSCYYSSKGGDISNGTASESEDDEIESTEGDSENHSQRDSESSDEEAIFFENRRGFRPPTRDIRAALKDAFSLSEHGNASSPYLDEDDYSEHEYGYEYNRENDSPFGTETTEELFWSATTPVEYTQNRPEEEITFESCGMIHNPYSESLVWSNHLAPEHDEEGSFEGSESSFFSEII